MPIEPLCGIACEGAARTFPPLWLILLLVVFIVPLILRKPWHGLVIYFVLLFLGPTNSVTEWSMFKEALLFIVLVLTLCSYLMAKRSYGKVLPSPDDHRTSFLLPKGYVGIVGLLALVVTLSSFHLWLRPEFFQPTIEAGTFVARWKYIQIANSILVGASIYLLVRSRKDLETLLKVIVISGSILAVQSLLIYPFRIEVFFALGQNTEGLVIDERLIELTRRGSAEIGRVFMWPALLALFLGISIRGRGKGQLLLLGSIMMLALVLTFTRAAYLGITTSVLVFIMFSPALRRLRAVGVFSLIGVVLGTVMLLMSWNVEVDPTGRGAGRFTNPFWQIQTRAATWEQALYAATENPLGYGLGTSSRITGRLMAEAATWGAPGRSLHQFYLDWLVDAGILGLAFICILIFMISRLLWKTIYQFRPTTNSYVSTYASILLAILPSMLVFGFFDSAFILPQLFVWLALAFVLQRLLVQETETEWVGTPGIPRTGKPATAKS